MQHNGILGKQHQYSVILLIFKIFTIHFQKYFGVPLAMWFYCDVHGVWIEKNITLLRKPVYRNVPSFCFSFDKSSFSVG